MRVLKEKYLNEYQKCGEIMVTVRENKFAMACSFCKETFAQLQSFMRHLQLQHNDKLPFNREVEIYAVEELLSPIIVSGTTEQGNEGALLQYEDNTNWLSDMQWLDGGAIHNSLKPGEEVSEGGNGFENISILKALEDYDISPNFLENMNTTLSDIGDEENNIITSTLLKEIQVDNYESHNSIENLTNKICSTGKTLINETKDVEKDHMPPEKPKDYNKQSPIKGIKNLLKGLDDLEEVDALLENLEDSRLRAEDFSNGSKNLLRKQEDSKNSSKNYGIYEKQDFPYKNFYLGSRQQVSETSEIMEPRVTSKNSSTKRIINKLPRIPANQTFGYKIKDLELMLDEHTTDKDKELSFIIANEYEVNNIAKSPNTEAQMLNLSLENLNWEPDVQTKSKTEFAKESCRDLWEDSNLQYFEKPVCAEMLSESSLNDALNEDLAKALADALADEDTVLLKMQSESKPDETLSEKLINLLNRELNEPEYETLLLKPSEVISADKNEIHEEHNTMPDSLRTKEKSSSEFKENPKKLSSDSILQTKYRKTNLKAKRILNGRFNPLAQTTVQRTAFTANNRILNDKQHNCIRAAVPKVIKGDHAAFSNQMLHEAITNKPQAPEKIPNPSKQRKTPNKGNKENSTPLLSADKVKKEKPTPHTNFINTHRGERTPLKAEQMFLKQSPKTQEKREALQIKTTPKANAYEMQENLNDHEGIILQNKLRKTFKIEASREQLNVQTNLNAQEVKLAQIKRENVPQTQELITPQTKCQRTPEALNCKKSSLLQENYILNAQNMFSVKRQRTPLNPKTESQTEKTPETTLASNKKFEPKIIKRPSPVESKMQFNNKRSPLTPPNETLNENNVLLRKSLRPPLTTPQRIKKLSVKLPKFTPEKLMQKCNLLTTNVKNNRDTDLNSLLNEFKLPEGITITKITSKDVDTTQSQNQDIDETPVKMGYCKQNFFEPSLQAEPNDLIVKPDTKPQSIADKLRQHKVSFDVLTNNTETTKTPRHSNLNYKSYAVNRTARKKEVLQRMRNIKKQIFKSIDSDNCTLTKVNKSRSSVMKHQQRTKIHIENVQLLPAIPKAAMLTSLINSSKNLNDDQKQAKKSLENPQMSSPINDDEKLLKKSLKRAASTPLLNVENPAKRSVSVDILKQQKESKESITKPPQKQQHTRKTKRNNFDVTQLDLGECLEKFLQGDLSANRSNVESFLNEDLPSDDITPDETSLESSAKDSKNDGNQKDDDNNCNLIDDLLQQVDNEQKSLNKTEIEFENNSEIVEDFNEAKDIELLDQFGLKIIKLIDIEDVLTLEELETINEKAKRFADFYKRWPRMWSSKHCIESGAIKEELNMSCQHMLTEINSIFNINLSISELKRLMNLISFWYGYCFNSKLIGKKEISESTNRYLKMFNYMPKIVRRRLYFCEYCSEYFYTENRYFNHRIKHTGALYPYCCQICSTGFKTFKALKIHQETICKGSKCQCKFCLKLFDTSDMLYEHSKEHLSTVYNCSKCELVFASEVDVKNHLAICNKNSKRRPKLQYTPRPSTRRRNLK